MYSALLISRYIIKRCNEINKSISNLKLQKLLYFVQAEFLVSKGEPCFFEEIEAWDFGPVVPVVYRKYKIYGSASIPYTRGVDSGKILNKDKSLINGIVDECAKYSAAMLVEVTHAQDPWKKAYKRYQNNKISNDSIKKYFEED